MSAVTAANWRGTIVTRVVSCRVMCRYLEANVTMSSGWRQGPADIPTEFHHRPGHLIRHMQDVTSKAVSISSDMVMTNDAGYHTVRSSQRKTVYKVDIGDAERMPSCSCYAFQRHHLPCKHFAAVFLHKQLTWSSLPANYRDHPILTCDSDCLAEFYYILHNWLCTCCTFTNTTGVKCVLLCTA